MTESDISGGTIHSPAGTEIDTKYYINPKNNYRDFLTKAFRQLHEINSPALGQTLRELQ